MAYYLLCCDIEKACDEAVTEHLEPEDRQEYAAVLLSMATDTTARRIFAAPVCFDEGDIRGRIRHILKCRKNGKCRPARKSFVFLLNGFLKSAPV